MIAREVEFAPPRRPQVYHAVEQADYVSIVAVTPEGRIPIVRQYRPALEDFSWELPAGLVDAGEDPARGLPPRAARGDRLYRAGVHRLGDASPCTGRLSNRIHAFFVETGERATSFEPEPGITVKLVTPAELARMIRAGEFVSQLHIGALLLAELHGFSGLAAGGPAAAAPQDEGEPQAEVTRRIAGRGRAPARRSADGAPPAR